ncbi:DUF6191 domain-containing protein [Nocardia sp. NBC_00508]|uniref:DUF6191 domain-containing protein n=1 Tax=Nocardia sp. NBC_00508 TaxID=2975992 RepID=UPI002E8057F4|nr:DUF6191 domain-containing protein [Nocardia sp. NBC_00508]WUD69660.1 DUF6191 domain-containing protein [Nocardia sp. NBC_00508]
MASVLQWSIPGWVILLVLVAVYELTVNKRRRGRRTPLSGTFTDEFTALFYATKRMELDHRESVSMLRDERDQGAPPLVGVDLDRHTVVLRKNDHR